MPVRSQCKLNETYRSQRMKGCSSILYSNRTVFLNPRLQYHPTRMHVLTQYAFWIPLALELHFSVQSVNVSDVTEEVMVDHTECLNSTFHCDCVRAPCIRKCCPSGQYVNNNTCEDTATEWDVYESCASRPIHKYLTCKNGTERVLLTMCDDFSVADGYLLWPLINMSFSLDDFCVDYIDARGIIQALVCIQTEQEIMKIFSPGIFFLLARFQISNNAVIAKSQLYLPKTKFQNVFKY